MSLRETRVPVVLFRLALLAAAGIFLRVDQSLDNGERLTDT
jgi:hypothetical protein